MPIMYFLDLKCPVLYFFGCKILGSVGPPSRLYPSNPPGFMGENISKLKAGAYDVLNLLVSCLSLQKVNEFSLKLGLRSTQHLNHKL